MKKNSFITGHCLVKNEDQFIWFALNSILPYLDRILVYDTGSEDRTVDIIKRIGSPKIEFKEMGKVTPAELVRLRQDQIDRTTSEFFMLVDGDEIWPKRAMDELSQAAHNLTEEKLAIFCRTRNAVGDVYHYLPEDAGRYQLAGKKGHLNIRLYRKRPGITVVGVYPLETYLFDDKLINDRPEWLEFLDVWYLHATHLKRSSMAYGPKYKYELGLVMDEKELPEVFFENYPRGIPSPLFQASPTFWLKAALATPFKRLRRRWQRS